MNTMLELVQQTCILQQGMPESGLQKQTENRDELDCYSQVCEIPEKPFKQAIAIRDEKGRLHRREVDLR